MAAGRGHLRVGRCGLDRWSEPCSVASMISDLMGANHHTTKLRDFVMDNVTSLPSATTSCVIKLDQFQYAFYQQSQIEIQSPFGICLTRIGEEINSRRDEEQHFQLWEQVVLLEILLEQINDDLKLPARAVTCLADLMTRVNAHFLKHAE